MLDGRNKNEWEHSDVLACASFNAYRTKKDWVERGAFNPFASRKKKTTGMESLNHETCPHLYYRGDD